MRKEEALAIARILGVSLEERTIQHATQYIFTFPSGERAYVNVYLSGKILYQGKESLKLQIENKYKEIQLLSKIYFGVPNYLLDTLNEGSVDNPTVLAACIREVMTRIENFLRSKLASQKADLFGKRLIEEALSQIDADSLKNIRKEDIKLFLLGLFGFRNYVAHNSSEFIGSSLSPEQLKLLLATSIFAESLLSQILADQ